MLYVLFASAYDKQVYGFLCVHSCDDAVYLWDWLEAWSTAGWRGLVSDSFLAEDSILPLPEPGGEERADSEDFLCQTQHTA